MYRIDFSSEWPESKIPLINGGAINIDDSLLGASHAHLLSLISKLLKGGRYKQAGEVVDLLCSCKRSQITMFAKIKYLYHMEKWDELYIALTEFSSGAPIISETLLTRQYRAACILKRSLATSANIPYYSISLSSQSERFKRQINNFSKNGLSNHLYCWKAIDGRGWPQEAFRKFGKMLGSQIGLAMSHMSIWKSIIEKKLSACVVLEDDAYLISPIPESLINNINESGYELVWLTERRTPDSYLNSICNDNKMSISLNDIICSDPGTGTEGYLVTYEGALKLFSYYSEVIFLAKDHDIDVFMTACSCIQVNKQCIHLDNKKLERFYSRVTEFMPHVSPIRSSYVFPWLVEQRDFLVSTMNYERSTAP